MDVDKDRRWVLLRRCVDDVLFSHWDPIGVKDAPRARDEYDAYINGVITLIYERAPAERIAQHLRDIEVERMGLLGQSDEVLLPIAGRLAELAKTLE